MSLKSVGEGGSITTLPITLLYRLGPSQQPPGDCYFSSYLHDLSPGWGQWPPGFPPPVPQVFLLSSIPSPPSLSDNTFSNTPLDSSPEQLGLSTPWPLTSYWETVKQLYLLERPQAGSHTYLSSFVFCCVSLFWPNLTVLPGESQGQGSLVGCRLWGRTESDTTEVI